MKSYMFACLKNVFLSIMVLLDKVLLFYSVVLLFYKHLFQFNFEILFY